MLERENIQSIPESSLATIHWLESVLHQQGDFIQELRVAEPSDNPAEGLLHLTGTLVSLDDTYEAPQLDIIFHHVCMQIEVSLADVNSERISKHFADFSANVPRDPRASDNVQVTGSFIDLTREEPIDHERIVLACFIRYDAPNESLFHEFWTLTNEYHPIQQFAANYKPSAQQ